MQVLPHPPYSRDTIFAHLIFLCNEINVMLIFRVGTVELILRTLRVEEKVPGGEGKRLRHTTLIRHRAILINPSRVNVSFNFNYYL